MGRAGATHRHRPTGRQDESQSGNLEVGTPGTRRAENSQLGPESPYLWGLAGACVSVSVCVRTCVCSCRGAWGACTQGRAAMPGVQWGSVPDRPAVC